VIVTDHHEIDYEQLVDDAQLVVDLRNRDPGAKGPAIGQGLQAVSANLGLVGLGHWGPNLARNSTSSAHFRALRSRRCLA